MNVCAEFAALLDLYLDGELSREEMSAVAEHLENCSGCQAYVDDGLAVRAAFPQAEEAPLPEGFAESVMEAVRQTPQAVPAAGGRTAGRRWIRFAVPLAACFAVVLALRLLPAGGSMENTILTASSAGGSSSGALAEREFSGQDACAPESAEEWKASTGPFASPAGGENGYEQDYFGIADQGAVPPWLEEDAFDSAAVPPQEPAASGPEAGREKPEEGLRAAIPAGQADLLADYVPRQDENGETVYRLTREEYQMLAEALAGRGVAAELPEELPETVWVYLE